MVFHGHPQGSRLLPVKIASELAKRRGRSLKGPDLKVNSLGKLLSRHRDRDHGFCLLLIDSHQPRPNFVICPASHGDPCCRIASHGLWCKAKIRRGNPASLRHAAILWVVFSEESLQISASNSCSVHLHLSSSLSMRQSSRMSTQVYTFDQKVLAHSLGMS